MAIAIGSEPGTGTETEVIPPKRVLITSSELQAHNSPSDLWISIQGKVYDVTRWVDSHPGGDLPILNLAGQDATDAFIAYHPPSAWAHLRPYLVGHLSDYQVSPASKDFRRLAGEISKLGLYDIKGHGIFYSFIFIAFLFLSSISLVFLAESWAAHLLAGVIMGYFWIQSTWIGHDAGHYNIMTSKRAHKFAGILTGNCFTGLSMGWWKRNHTAHHIACNSLDFDPDLQHLPLFVVSSKFFNSLTSFYYNRKMTFDAAARFFISYQHWTFYPVMCFGRFNLFAQSFLLLFSSTKVPDRLLEIAGLVVFWVWYPLLVSCLPSWGERLMFVLASFCVTSMQHVQFTLNHFSADVYVGPPTGNDWLEKQTAGSMDIICPPWMDWFHGGLQFQVEHHVFPRLPRCHLRAMSPVIKELCKKHGLTYRSAGFIDANRKTLKVLKTAAMEARDLTNPAPKNLLWEALNTHG